MNKNNWEVYKSEWSSSWNWVASYKGKVIDKFPTKKKAEEFVIQQQKGETK